MRGTGEWVAHNLCSVNSILPKELQYYGIGYLSKAFGLWYANVQTCIGMTQWTSPSVRLHSYFGDFEVLTAYTPVHSYGMTLTYRLNVEPASWGHFFLKQPREGFQTNHVPAGFMVDRANEKSLIEFQKKLEAGEGPFYLDSRETIVKELTEPLTIYRKI